MKIQNISKYVFALYTEKNFWQIMIIETEISSKSWFYWNVSQLYFLGQTIKETLIPVEHNSIIVLVIEISFLGNEKKTKKHEDYFDISVLTGKMVKLFRYKSFKFLFFFM